MLALLLGEPGRSGLEIVREYWRRQSLPGDFEICLAPGPPHGRGRRHGAETQGGHAARQRNPEPGATRRRERGPGDRLPARPGVWDGRFANNAWLQELPRPLTRLTWDNAALISPAQASRLGVARGRHCRAAPSGADKCRSRPMIMPGQADLSVTVTLGYGRRRAGRVGNGVGVDVYGLRTADEPWFGSGLEVVKTGQSNTAWRPRSTTIGWRAASRFGSPASTTLPQEPRFRQGARAGPRRDGPSLFDDPAPKSAAKQGTGNAWGMAINLNTCIGCGACVTACQAENNIPVVGREQVLASREMHWIRIDRYFEGEATTTPPIDFQPVACMHCEKAPCEVVCPVGATTHSAEGLNEMTYNRCVGTRYCSNNCPYKVRRFNFFQYSDEETPSLKLMRNPDVTVRPRGVMEKCTYCVQRINEARIAAEIAGSRRRRRRGRDRVPGGLPDPGDRLRQHQRQGQRGGQGQGQPAQLWPAGRAEHPAADHVPGQAAQSQPRDRGDQRAMTRTEILSRRQPRQRPSPVLAPGHTYGSVTDKISALVLVRPYNWRWFLGIGDRRSP